MRHRLLAAASTAVVISSGASGPAIAGTDAHAELLQALRVHHAMFLYVDATPGQLPRIDFIIDDEQLRTARRSLPSDLAIRVPGGGDGQVTFYVVGLNPLRTSIHVGASLVADPSAAAMKSYLDNLNAFEATRQLFGPSTGAGGVKTSTSVSARPETTDCSELKTLAETVDKAYADLFDESLLSDTKLEDWITRADKPANLAIIEKEMRKMASDLRDHVDAVKKTFKALDDEADEAAAGKALGNCNLLTSRLLVRLHRLARQGELVLGRKSGIADALDKLADCVKPHETMFNWDDAAGPMPAEIIYRISPREDSIEVVTLKTSALSLANTDTGPALSESEARVVQIRVLTDRGVFFESGAAILYNFGRYPIYGTAAKGDTTVVTKALDEYGGAEPALTVSMIFQAGWPRAWSPLLQFGVVPDSKRPALVFGGGLRLTAPYPFAVSGGILLPWIRQLEQLKEGDPVDGTSAIEADTKAKFSPDRPAAYLALQLQF